MSIEEPEVTLSVLGQVSYEDLLDTVKAMSDAPDPAEFSRIFAERMGSIFERDRFLYISRRGLEPPKYRVTRFSEWEQDSNPWTELDQFPVYEGGLLGELVFGNEPRLITDLSVEPSDPSFEYLGGMGSLIALPQYERREALNMSIFIKEAPDGYQSNLLGELVWTTNLMGRAVHSLRLGDELEEAYRVIDREMRAVSDVQQSLLPKQLPTIPTLELAASYQTAQHAGGDYYDFLPLPDGKWGILIADVCGHGAAAAVLMAITHAILHTSSTETDPGVTLMQLNEKLLQKYTNQSRAFVTAFYGVYDPKTRRMQYASAGHDYPRVRRAADGEIVSLPTEGNLPLGVGASDVFARDEYQFEPGDTFVLYTDGITEARSDSGAFFDTDGIEATLRENHGDAEAVLAGLLEAVRAFTGGKPQHDDRAVIVGRIT